MTVIWGLLKDTYTSKGTIAEERTKLQSVLETRAWACHISTTATRVIYPILGIAYWQKGFKNMDKVEGVNTDFVNAYRVPIIYLIMAFVSVCVAADIVIWKWRKLARFLFFLECFGVVLYSLTPIDLGDLGEL